MEHTDSCVCGSTDINVIQKLNSPVELSEIQCAACGTSVSYELPKGKAPPNTRGEVFEELLITWNKTMVAEKLVKQLNLTKESYIKEELVTNLLTLTHLVEQADQEGVSLSCESKKKIVDMLGLVQRIIPALEGLEQASTVFFNEALESLLDTKGSLKFQVREK